MTARSWWVWTVRGALAVVFGLLAFALPGLTITTLVLLFAAMAFVDGALAIGAALVGKRSWGAVLLEGLVGIGAGLVTFFRPGLTILALVYTVAVWAFVTGVLEIVAAVRLRHELKGEWVLALAGALSVLFALALALAPIAGIVALAWMVGFYCVAFGAALIALGLRLRRFERAGTPPLGFGEPAATV